MKRSCSADYQWEHRWFALFLYSHLLAITERSEEPWQVFLNDLVNIRGICRRIWRNMTMSFCATAWNGNRWNKCLC